MWKQRLVWLGALFVLAGSLGMGCTPRVVVHSVVPPQLVMPNVRSVAVIPFRPRRWGGKEGLILSDLIANHLSSDQARRLFSVVEGAQLGAVHRQQSLRRSFASNELTGFGRRMNAQAVIVGRVTSYYVHSRYWRKREIYYRDGVKYTRIIRCLTRRGSVGATLRVVRTANAQVLHSLSRIRTVRSEGCGLGRDQVLSRFTLLQQAMQRLAHSLSSPLVPEVQRLVVPIETGGRDKRLNIGVKHAKRGSWDRATELWKMVLRADPRHYKALYNLGVAAEVRGDLPLARRYYRRANRLSSKSWYARGVQRIDHRLQNRSDMQRLQKRAQPKQPNKPTMTHVDDPTAPSQPPPPSK